MVCIIKKFSNSNVIVNINLDRIRIIISSSADDKAKYKQRLFDWLVAICLIFFYALYNDIYCIDSSNV